MPVNIGRLFDSCPEIPGFQEKHEVLLENILSISNPMDFDKDFASDDELDELELAIDRLGINNPNTGKFKKIIDNLKAKRAFTSVFI